MTKKYDTVVLIGRFQPVHNAHVEILKRAVALANNIVIVVGSAYQPRTFKNPFSEIERESMLEAILEDKTIFPDEDFRYTIAFNPDTIYNDIAWMQRVQSLVADACDPAESQHVAIIGHSKDESSFYLKMFPQWKHEEIELIEPLNATNIRDLYFKRDLNMRFIANVVPKATLDFLDDFWNRAEHEQIIREREFVETYKLQYAGLKYPPTFITGDSVVLCAGHVLLIKRRAEPGKGLWALPGGYMMADKDRSVRDTALRELREETKIKVPLPVLMGSIKRSEVFDAIDRSPRGRIVTHAFLIELNLVDGKLPQVKGSDDAEKAKWVPLADVLRWECFEDHYEIIQNMVGA